MQGLSFPLCHQRGLRQKVPGPQLPWPLLRSPGPDVGPHTLWGTSRAPGGPGGSAAWEGVGGDSHVLGGLSDGPRLSAFRGNVLNTQRRRKVSRWALALGAWGCGDQRLPSGGQGPAPFSASEISWEGLTHRGGGGPFQWGVQVGNETKDRFCLHPTLRTGWDNMGLEGRRGPY